MVWETDLSAGRGLGRACVCSGGLGAPGGGVGAPGAGAAGVVAAGVCEGAAAGVDSGFCWLRRSPRWACAGTARAGRVRARRIAGAIRLKVMQRIVLDVLAGVGKDAAAEHGSLLCSFNGV